MAIELVAAGSFTQSTGAPVIALPSGVLAGHLLILAVHSANQAVARPGDYIELSSSPQGTGTAAAAGGVRLTVFYKIAGAAETSVTLADSGDITGGVIYAFRNVDVGSPILASVGNVQASAATAWSVPAITVSGEDSRILWLIANDRDANATTNTTATHSTLAVTELTDQTTNAGTGGGISAYLANTDVTNTTVAALSVTSASSNTAAFITIALKSVTTFDASASLSSSTSGNISTNIRLASSSSIWLSAQGEVITPAINMLTQANILTTVSSSLGSYSTFATSAIISSNTSPSLSTSIRLGSISNISATSSAAVTTSIRLSANNSIVNTAASNTINTSIRLATTSNTQVLANNPTLRNYNTFSSTSNLVVASSPGLLTSIRLSASANVFNTSSTPILGKTLSLSGNALISIGSNTPSLVNFAALQSTGLLTIIPSANLRIGVSLFTNASISAGAQGLLIPDWVLSNLEFPTGAKTIVFKATNSGNLYDAPARSSKFEGLHAFSYKTSYIYSEFSSPHTFNYVSPIDRLKEL